MPGRSAHISRSALVVLVAVTLVACLPFLGSVLPYVDGHDMTFHLARIESIAQGLAQGQFPVRLYPAMAYGTGYPCGICYPDAFLYLPAALRLAGVALEDAYAVLAVLANLLTSAVAFASFSGIFRSERVALGCTTLWLLFPYRLVDLFVRASVGEYLALAFAPAIAFGVWDICLGEGPGSRRGWLALGCAMAGVVQSHVLSVALFLLVGAPLVILALALGSGDRPFASMLGALGKACLVCAGLSASFAVPFLDYYLSEPLQVRHAVNDMGMQALQPYQVIGAFWPFSGESLPLWEGPAGDMPTPVGAALTLVALVSAVTLSMPGQLARLGRGRVTILRALLALSLVLAWVATCLFPWGVIGTDLPLAGLLTALGAIQFPWRLVGPLGFLLVLAAGVLVCPAPRSAAAGSVGGPDDPDRAPPGAGPGGGLAMTRPSASPGHAWAVPVVCLTLAVVEALFACTTFLSAAQTVTWELCDAISAHEERAIGNGEYLTTQSSWETVDASPALPRSTATVEVGGWEHDAVTRATLMARNLRDRPSVTTLPVLWNGLWEARAQGGADAGAPVELMQIAGFVAVRLPAGFAGTVELAFVEPPSWCVAGLVTLASLVAVAALALRPLPHRPAARR